MTALPTLDPEDSTDLDEMKKRLILVVDDSRLQRKILTSSLTRWGYEVVEAESGDEAIAICLKRNRNLSLAIGSCPG